jgi:hypothetical protein
MLTDALQAVHSVKRGRSADVRAVRRVLVGGNSASLLANPTNAAASAYVSIRQHTSACVSTNTAALLANSTDSVGGDSASLLANSTNNTAATTTPNTTTSQQPPAAIFSPPPTNGGCHALEGGGEGGHLSELSSVSIASQRGVVGGGEGGSVGIGLTLKKNSAGDFVVSRVKVGGPAAKEGSILPGIYI